MISCIVCHHKGTFVVDCIRSLLLSKEVVFEIIIVTSDKAFKSDDATVVYAQGGPAYKRNVGVRYAQYENLAFFDDDVEVDQYCLFHLERTLQDASVGMVYGKTLNAEKRDHFDCAGSFLTSTGFLYAREQSGIEDRGQYEVKEPILAGKSANCIIKRSVFAKAGMFDSFYEILGEETDLSWRVWHCGYKVIWCPQATAWHWFNTSRKTQDFYSHKRVYFNGCRNYLSMLYTNLGRINLIKILPIHFMCWVIAAITMYIGGRREACKHIFGGLWFFLTHIPKEKRKSVQKMRVSSDRILFKTIKKNPPIEYFKERLLRYVKVGLHG